MVLSSYEENTHLFSIQNTLGHFEWKPKETVVATAEKERRRPRRPKIVLLLLLVVAEAEGRK